MNNETFGERLRKYREVHHITQVQLGDLMHLTSGHISLLERNEKRPKASIVLAFQGLTESEEWQRFDIVRELSEVEFNTYMRLWQQIRRLGEQKKKEVMVTFLNILGLL